MGHGLGGESNTHRVRYPPGEQGGGCSRAGCYTPHQQHLFLHEMPVPQRLRQHPRAHACCLPGLLSRPLAKGRVCWGRAGTSLGPRGRPGSWLSPRALCPEPGCHLPASSPMPPAGARTLLEEQRGDTSRRDGTASGDGAPSSFFSHLAWQDLSQPSSPCSGCAAEETLPALPFSMLGCLSTFSIAEIPPHFRKQDPRCWGQGCQSCGVHDLWDEESTQSLLGTGCVCTTPLWA